MFRRDENQVDYDMKLKKPDQGSGLVLSGRVLRPDGKPLAGAAVTLTYPLNGNGPQLPTAHFENGELKRSANIETVETDQEGRFSVVRSPNLKVNTALIVVHPDYYVELPCSAIAVIQTITAKRWGRIEGEVLIRGRPAAGAAVRYFSDRMGNLDVPHIRASGKTKADDHGRFVFERVIPGDVRVTRDFGDGPNLKAWSNGSLVEVRGGNRPRRDRPRRTDRGRENRSATRIGIKRELRLPLGVRNRKRPAEYSVSGGAPGET